MIGALLRPDPLKRVNDDTAELGAGITAVQAETRQGGVEHHEGSPGNRNRGQHQRLDRSEPASSSWTPCQVQNSIARAPAYGRRCYRGSALISAAISWLRSASAALIAATVAS